jgi:hypothetical protein
MKIINVNDAVMVIVPNPKDYIDQNTYTALNGRVGVVKQVVSHSCAIEFYESFVGAHNCGGLTHPNRGYNVPMEMVKQVYPVKVVVEKMFKR